jgi:hypothetical protein
MRLLRALLPSLHSNQKLLLAFEYGVILTQTVQKLGFELTEDQMISAERMILTEFKENDATTIAQQMLPNILAILEPKD